MTVLWLFLKIIGILLLTVLGIILMVLLLLLFVPVRYRAEGSYQGCLKTVCQITWLFGLITIKAVYDGAFTSTVRAAGIRLYPKPEKKPGRIKKSGKKEGTGDAPVPADSENSAPSALAEEKEAPVLADEAVLETENPCAGHKEQPSARRRRRINPIHKLADKLKELAAAFWRKFHNIQNKWITVKENIVYYKNLLEREDSRRAIHLVWSRLIKIIRHILPQKMDVYFIIGAGDPGLTGQIMALQGVFYPLLGNQVHMIPDFDEKHLEGEFYLKGHVTACMLVICALQVAVNKEVRQFIKLLRKKEEA